MMDSTLVIPQRGHIELTLDCLDSLRRVESKRWPVVVVDDGSTMEEVERFDRLKPPGVRLVTQFQAGVTAAWNLGALQVCTKAVLFINNDVLFRTPSVEAMLEPLNTKTARMTGVRYRIEPNVPVGSLNEELPEDETIRLLEGWALSCFVEDYYRIGGFDEQFQTYFSDTDFQLRMREEFGSSCLKAIGDIGLEHLGHRTAHLEPTHRQQWRRDRKLFRLKWKQVKNRSPDIAFTSGL
ncbi:Glycosyl transferase family 2 [Polystyrenella longa]|uniref:Glycosyl transferase family 2 n=1 Tax=Polystyrenella longa TaxID=2528007 RepID=A0A518CIF8_9PLAN|nr:glycosyltransferase [Polystyrenella longa]QDU78987.1 Glycosyl transferase family 2 [Polystyrenella longa]